jgi:hypothetical protein
VGLPGADIEVSQRPARATRWLRPRPGPNSTRTCGQPVTKQRLRAVQAAAGETSSRTALKPRPNPGAASPGARQVQAVRPEPYWLWVAEVARNSGQTRQVSRHRRARRGGRRRGSERRSPQRAKDEGVHARFGRSPHLASTLFTHHSTQCMICSPAVGPPPSV